MSLRPFTLCGRLGNRGLGRLLLRGADRVEALLQRIHQVDGPGWRLDRRRDDLLACNLGLDDAMQPFAIFVLVVGQVDRPSNVAITRWASFISSSFTVVANEFSSSTVLMLRISAAWCGVYITMPRSCGRTATRYRRPPSASLPIPTLPFMPSRVTFLDALGETLFGTLEI